MHRRRELPVLIAVSIATTVFLLQGCGGGPNRIIPGTPPGGGGGGGTPPPATGTATIQATVVDASNVGTTIAGALVRVLNTALEAFSDAQGALTLNNVPEGTVTLDVSFPSTGAYQGTQVAIETAANATTQVRIAAVPAGSVPPNSILLNPAAATIDIGGQILFEVDVRTFGAPVKLMPTLSLNGNVGLLLPSGLFTATTVGTGKVTAHVEGATDSSTIEVVGPRAPRLGTLSVAPASLPSDGGAVRIAISATDGDGIKSVVARIERPNRSALDLTLFLETGTSLDGSWGNTYIAPANDNPPDSQGVQLEQRYSVRVTVEDNQGTTAQSRWVDFVVAGLQAPPGPP